MLTINGVHPRGTRPRSATGPRSRTAPEGVPTGFLHDEASGREAVLLNVTELRVKAGCMRDRADQQSDAGAAAAYRLMAEHYEAIALLREVEEVTPGYG